MLHVEHVLPLLELRFRKVLAAQGCNVLVEGAARVLPLAVVVGSGTATSAWRATGALVFHS